MTAFRLLLILVPFALIVFIVLAAAANSARNKMAALQKLAGPLPGGVEKRFGNAVFKGEADGRRCEISIVNGGDENADRVFVAVVAESSFKLSVYRESALLRWIRKFGMMRKIETYDPDFDRDFAVSSASEISARNFIGASGTKEAVRAVFGGGFHSIEIRPGRIIVEKRYMDAAKELEPEKIAAAAKSLSRLADNARY